MTVNRWMASTETPYEITKAHANEAVAHQEVCLARLADKSVPLQCHWGEGAGCRPVPLRCWKLAEPNVAQVAWSSTAPRGSTSAAPVQNLLWPTLGAPNTPFHFSTAMRELLADIVSRVPEVGHIRPEQVHVGVTRCSRRPVGLLGRITPLRFPGGALWRHYGTWQVTLQRYWLRGSELLYLIAFPLPRFLDLPFEEKMVTIFHELCHISPQFNGDLNRHPGRYCLHTRSKKAYDRRMALLVRAYLESRAKESKFAFLRMSARELLQCFGAIVGEWLPVPRLVRFLHNAELSTAAATPMLATAGWWDISG